MVLSKKKKNTQFRKKRGLAVLLYAFLHQLINYVTIYKSEILTTKFSKIYKKIYH